MEEQTTPNNRPVNPRRRKRSKWEIFKEAYLPLIIIAVAFILILVIIIGSITRAVQKKKAQTPEPPAISDQNDPLDEEVKSIAAQAELKAAAYDYEGAIAVIDSFSGNLADYPVLAQMRQNYEAAMNQMTVWDDPSKIPNLSFHPLVVDAQRGFSFPGYESSNKQHYITVSEFTNILQSLYDNGYILVSLSDVYTTTTAEDGSTVCATKALQLPQGKKPLILTETNVNYYTYLADTDGDKLSDKNGAGFATRMVVGSDGRVDCEYIDADGQTHIGAYDLVPILDDFIDAHPDFSYNGARAIICVTGYDGVFGYRTNPDAEHYFGTAEYDQFVADATAVANALKDSGYDIACYTYHNTPYGSLSTEEMQQDVDAWLSQVAPIVGETDIMVYAQKSDITENLTYSGDKYDVLYNAGFRYYLGFSNDGAPWTIIDDTYVRQGRIMVTGYNLSANPEWFSELFDAASVLDSSVR